MKTSIIIKHRDNLPFPFPVWLCMQSIIVCILCSTYFQICLTIIQHTHLLWNSFGGEVYEQRTLEGWLPSFCHNRWGRSDSWQWCWVILFKTYRVHEIKAANLTSFYSACRTLHIPALLSKSKTIRSILCFVFFSFSVSLLGLVIDYLMIEAVFMK